MTWHPASVVGAVWEHTAAGWTQDRILNWLVEQRIPTAEGLAPEQWTRGRVRDMLRRGPTYLGHIKIGQYWDPERVSEAKKQGKTIEIDDELYLRDTHPAIITQELYDRVQARRAAGSTHGVRGTGPELLLPRGKVRCGGCGHMMVAVPSTKKGYRTYSCPSISRRTAHCCAPAQIQDVSGPRSFGLADYVVASLVEHKKESEIRDVASEQDDLLQLEKRRQEIEERRATLGEREEEFIDRYGEEGLRRRTVRLKGELAEVNMAILRKRELIDGPDDNIPSARELEEGWDNLPRREQHRILDATIQLIAVYANPPLPELVAEARKLAAKGVGPKRIAAAFGRREHVVAGWLKNENATGAEVGGASGERVKIAWQADPDIKVPRPGKRDWGHRKYPFADVLSGPPQPKGVPEYSIEELLRTRADDALDEVFDVLAESDRPLTVVEVTAALPVNRESRYVQVLLNTLHEQGRAGVMGKRGKARLWEVYGPAGTSNGSVPEPAASTSGLR
jgi:hypothetical protein